MGLYSPLNGLLFSFKNADNKAGVCSHAMQAAPRQQAVVEAFANCRMALKHNIRSLWCDNTSFQNLTVTSSRNSSMQLKSWLMYWGSLRIMPGALSRASHKVTRNSAASCLMPSGN